MPIGRDMSRHFGAAHDTVTLIIGFCGLGLTHAGRGGLPVFLVHYILYGAGTERRHIPRRKVPSTRDVWYCITGSPETTP